MSGLVNHNDQPNNSNLDDIIEVEPKYKDIQNLSIAGNRYRSILENLLQLHQEQITHCVKKAIRLTTNLCRDSEKDWLRLLFKSLEVFLSTIDIQNVLLNDSYLEATTTALATVLETGNFLDLLRDKSITSEIRLLFNSDMSKVLNAVSLENVYKNANDVFSKSQRDEYVATLDLLKKMNAINDAAQMTEKQLTLWYDHVLTLMFDPDILIQDAALAAIESAIPHMLNAKHHEHPNWDTSKKFLISSIKLIGVQLQKNNGRWHRTWCICLRLLDIEIPRSASILNQFLSLVEPALRSAIMERRAEAYYCWRVLLEILAKHNRLDTEKRIKLVCTPLKAVNVKTMEIGLNKFRAWWFLMVHVESNIDVYKTMMFEPFLAFCFGPLSLPKDKNQTPLETQYHVKSYGNISMMATAGLAALLGRSNHTVRLLLKSCDMCDSDVPVIHENVFKGGDTMDMLISACGEATYTLSKFKQPEKQCSAVSNCLWENLIDVINRKQDSNDIFNMLEYIGKLLHVKIFNEGVDKTILLNLMLSILDRICKKIYIFTHGSYGIRLKAIAFIIKLLPEFPYPNPITTQIIDSLIAIPNMDQFNPDSFHCCTNGLLNSMFDITKKSETPVQVIKFRIWRKMILDISSWITQHRKQLSSLSADKIDKIATISMAYLHRPIMVIDLTIPVHEILKQYEKLSRPLSELMGKKVFIDQSVTIIMQALKNSLSLYTHEIIMRLFQYTKYDYQSEYESPSSLFDVVLAYITKDNAQCVRNVVTALLQWLRETPETKISYNREKLVRIFEQLANGPFSKTDQQVIDDLNVVLHKIKPIVQNGKQSPIIVPDVTITVVPNNNAKLAIADDNIRVISAIVPVSASTSTNVTTPVSVLGRLNVTTTPTTVVTPSNVLNKIASPGPQHSAPKKGEVKYVVVKNMWKLQPEKLTEHQRERMKERRSDIPALYNDMSVSQDSVSISEWAPRQSIVAVHSKKPAEINIDESAVDTVIVPESVETVPEEDSQRNNHTTVNSQQVTDNRSTSPELNTQASHTEIPPISLSQEDTEVPNSQPPAKKSNTTRRSGAENDKVKLRVARELLRIHIDAVESEPTDAKRRTRSVLKESPVMVRQAPAVEKFEAKPRRVRRLSNKLSSDSDSEPILNLRSVKQKLDQPTLVISEVQSSYTEHHSQAAVDKPEVDETPPVKKFKTEPQDIASATVRTNGADHVEKIIFPATEVLGAEPPVKEPTLRKNSLSPIPKSPPTRSPALSPRKATVRIEMLTEEQIRNAFHNHRSINLDTKASEEKAKITSLKDELFDLTTETNMSSLEYKSVREDSHLSVHENESIMTSPRVDDERNQEFLNDTSNISPIIQTIVDDAERINDTDKNKLKKSSQIANVDKPTTPMANSKRQNENLPQSPISTPTFSATRQSKHMFASTPVPANSPLSSRPKHHLTGRGAQLLKMINAKPQLDIVTPGTSAAAINHLQSAPICENATSPEPPSAPSLVEPTRTAQSELLTFSSILPSPRDSPAASILKRKLRAKSPDDEIISPAHKRKRVSFNVPLSEVKEYILDERALDKDGGNIAEVPRSPGSRLRIKLKRNRRQDSPKDMSKYPTSNNLLAVSNAEPSQNNHGDDSPEEEVTINQIKEYLSENQSHKTTQADDINVEEMEAAVLLEHAFDNELTALNTIQQIPTLNSEIITLNSFTEEQIFDHIMNKFATGEYGTNSAISLVNKLSPIMKNNNEIKNVIVKEFAVNHPADLLNHALTENPSNMLCERLMATNSSADLIDCITKQTIGDDTHKANLFESLTNNLNSDVKLMLIKKLTASLNNNAPNNSNENASTTVTSQEHSANSEQHQSNRLPNYMQQLMTDTFENNDFSSDDFVGIAKQFFIRKFGLTDSAAKTERKCIGQNSKLKNSPIQTKK